MNSTKKKVINLEKCMLQPMVKGSTVLDMEHIPEPEYRMFMEAKKIATNVKFEDLTPKQHQLLVAASQRMGERIIDLFFMWIESNITGSKDCMANSQFKKRLVWFMQELRKDSDMWNKADEIEEEHKGDNDEVDYVDKFFRTQPEHFTQDSWDKFENEIMQSYLKSPEGKQWLKNLRMK